MKDTKDVLEDIAERFEPTTDSFARYLHLHQERRQRRQRYLALTLLALLVVAASIAGIEASRATAARFPSALHFSKAGATESSKPTSCPDHNGTGAFVPNLSSSSGSPGSTVTVSGPLPVRDESGAYVGSAATEVIAYWNLDLDKWGTALTSPLSPAAAVAGSAVQLLGTQDVTGACNYAFQIKIPAEVSPGTYPIQLLIESSDETGVTTGPLQPANYRVTVS